MRLIDADKLFPYGSVPFYQDDGFRTADRIYGIIKNAPTVDAVEVVRCKDCRHWIERIADGIDTFHVCWFNGSITGRNHFCCCGERRTDG